MPFKTASWQLWRIELSLPTATLRTLQCRHEFVILCGCKGRVLICRETGERCKKREQPCPGYRNPRDRKFVRMTGRDKTASGASSETSASKQVEDLSFNRAPTPPPHQNFADQAVAFFFHQYIIGASENGNPGFLDFLPELYDLDRPDCALAHSIKAISYISLSAKSSVKVLAARGHEHYRLSLVRISHMLQSAEETAQDSLIVAIILIVLFEVSILLKLAVYLHFLISLCTECHSRETGCYDEPCERPSYPPASPWRRPVAQSSRLGNIPSRQCTHGTLSWLSQFAPRCQRQLTFLEASSQHRAFRIPEPRNTALAPGA